MKEEPKKKCFDTGLSAQERAEALVDLMTAEEQMSQLLTDASVIPLLGLPAYHWWNDGLHGTSRAGVAKMFPQTIVLAAMIDTEGMYRIADIISTETSAKITNTQSTATVIVTRA